MKTLLLAGLAAGCALTLAACDGARLPTPAEIDKAEADLKAGRQVLLAGYCAATPAWQARILAHLRKETGRPDLAFTCDRDGAALVGELPPPT